jgi:hypothetical protein
MTIDVCFDCEFTSLLDPHLLSVGLVTLDGREMYAELALESEVGQARLAATPWDVREGVIEDKWSLFPASVCDSDWSLGRRVGEWLLGVAESDTSGRVRLLYDYSTDLELLVGVLEECNLWPQVRVVANERNVAAETGRVGCELASEACFRSLRRRQPPLYRHHALADALALRAGWRTWRLIHERPLDFARLLSMVGANREGWLHEWLASPALAFGGRVALDVLDQGDGLQVVADALDRAEGNYA